MKDNYLTQPETKQGLTMQQLFAFLGQGNIKPPLDFQEERALCVLYTQYHKSTKEIARLMDRRAGTIKDYVQAHPELEDLRTKHQTNFPQRLD